MATELVQKSGLAVGIGVVFVVLGALKVFGHDAFEHMFAMWGYSQGFRFVIGVLEVLGGLLMMTGRGAPLGATILSIVLVGALYTHVFRGNPIFGVIPLGALVLVITGARNTRVYRSAHVLHGTEVDV